MRQRIRDKVVALPLAEQGEVIDEKTSLAVLEDLKRNGSIIPAHLSEQIASIVENLSPDIGIHPLILRGIVARAAIAGATQAVHDTGQAIQDIQAFREVVDVTLTAETDTPPAA